MATALQGTLDLLAVRGFRRRHALRLIFLRWLVRGGELGGAQDGA